MSDAHPELGEALLRLRSRILWRLALKNGYRVREEEILDLAKTMSDRDVLDRLSEPPGVRHFWRDLLRRWHILSGPQQ